MVQKYLDVSNGTLTWRPKKVVVGEDNVLIVPHGTDIITEHQYSGNEDISVAYIPEGVKEIESYAFADCKSLKQVVFSSSVKKIGNRVFKGCINLQEISFNDELETIGERCLQDCFSLSEIQFPKKLNDVGSGVLKSCGGLKKIYATDRIAQELVVKGDVRESAEITSYPNEKGIWNVYKICGATHPGIRKFSFMSEGEETIKTGSWRLASDKKWVELKSVGGRAKSAKSSEGREKV